MACTWFPLLTTFQNGSWRSCAKPPSFQMLSAVHPTDISWTIHQSSLITVPSFDVTHTSLPTVASTFLNYRPRRETAGDRMFASYCQLPSTECIPIWTWPGMHENIYIPHPYLHSVSKHLCQHDSYKMLSHSNFNLYLSYFVWTWTSLMLANYLY